MEVLFENQNTMSREQVIELYRKDFKPDVVNRIILQSSLLLLLGVFLFWSYMYIVVVGVTIFAMVKTLRHPKKQANRWYDKRLAYYDDVMTVTKMQFGEKIIVETRDATHMIEYRKIEKVLSLEHSYVIQYKEPGRLLLSRDGFTKGTFEEFKQFLREKCPEVTIPE